MQQLQAWADEGALILPCEEYPSGAVKTQEGILHTYMIHEYLQLVLDGTIQVWRPVEHYKPKDNEPVFLYDLNYSTEPFIGYYRSDDGQFHKVDVRRNYMTLVSPTHWQPLPQPPQEVK
jgi:hypothetical protein